MWGGCAVEGWGCTWAWTSAAGFAGVLRGVEGCRPPGCTAAVLLLRPSPTSACHPLAQGVQTPAAPTKPTAAPKPPQVGVCRDEALVAELTAAHAATWAALGRGWRGAAPDVRAWRNYAGARAVRAGGGWGVATISPPRHPWRHRTRPRLHRPSCHGAPDHPAAASIHLSSHTAPCPPHHHQHQRACSAARSRRAAGAPRGSLSR